MSKKKPTPSSSDSSGARPTAPPQIQAEPKPPFPPQHQEGAGRESDLKPRPRYEAPRYQAAGKLTGKAALITGGDSGIGRAVAVLFAREGADIAFTHLPEEEDDAGATRDAVEAEGRRCVLYSGDLLDPRFCRDVVEKTVSEFGRLDVLVSNAAHQNRKESLDELDDIELEETFQTNVHACVRIVRAALPHMKAGGSIIATGSETGILGSASLPDYSASKGAIHAFIKALAQQVITKGIRANVVAPGPVWTPLNPSDAGISPEKVAKFGQRTPLERPAQPEEVAPAFVFLASDADSSFISGIVLPVMGGEPVGV